MASFRPRRQPPGNPLQPVDPLQTAVNSQIQGQVMPYQNAIGQANTSFAADRPVAMQASNALAHGIAGDITNAKYLGGQQLGEAAQANTSGSAALQRNLAFLHGVFGDLNAGARAAQLHGTALHDAMRQQGNVGLASQIGLNNAGTTGYLSGLSATGRLANQDWLHQQGLNHSAYTQALGKQIAGIKATAPALYQQLQQQAFDNALKQQAFGLQQSQFNEGQRQFNASLQNQQNQFGQNLANNKDQFTRSLNARVDAATTAFGNKAAAAAQKVIGNQAAQYTKTANGVYKNLWRYVPNKSKDSKGNVQITGFTKLRPKDAFNLSLGDLINEGLPPDIAAAYATEWTRGYNIWGKPPAALNNLLSQGVSQGGAKRIITQMFGARGWALANPGKGLNNSYVGFYYPPGDRSPAGIPGVNPDTTGIG